MKYEFIIGRDSFVGLIVYSEGKDFQIMKGIDEDLKDKAPYFLQEALTEMSKGDYFP